MKIRVIYNDTSIVTVVDNTDSVTYIPQANNCMVAPSNEIKAYLQSKGIDTTPIDQYASSN